MGLEDLLCRSYGIAWLQEQEHSCVVVLILLYWLTIWAVSAVFTMQTIPNLRHCPTELVHGGIIAQDYKMHLYFALSTRMGFLGHGVRLEELQAVAHETVPAEFDA
jgi:hypothetical protein